MKTQTLNQNSDFRRLYYKGRSLSSPELVTYVLKNRMGKTRFGITVSKKIGNAVIRNRARRVIAAAFRTQAEKLESGYDICFVARTKTPLCKSQRIEAIMEKQLFSLTGKGSASR